MRPLESFVYESDAEHRAGEVNGYVEFNETTGLFDVFRDEDSEPWESFDLSDDADALASAGMGTDEDYGYYGDNY